MEARLADCSVDKFFLRYSNGKCVKQSIGINKFASMPKDIATFFNLPNADQYTGHSFRRTSTTLLVDAGAASLHFGDTEAGNLVLWHMVTLLTR